MTMSARYSFPVLIHCTAHFPLFLADTCFRRTNDLQLLWIPGIDCLSLLSV